MGPSGYGGTELAEEGNIHTVPRKLDHEGLALACSRTVPREWVHKRAVEQVLLTDVAKIGGRLLALAQLPRTHRLYNDSYLSGYDLLLLAEAGRQAGEAVVHHLMGVRRDRRFVVGSAQVKLLDRERVAVMRTPTELVLEFTPKKITRRPDGSYRQIDGLTLGYIEGVPVVEIRGIGMILDGSEYQDLRGNRAGSTQTLRPSIIERLAPEDVGKCDSRNVVLSRLRIFGKGIAADLVADPDDSVFFDHESDHLPGHLILEGARQSAVVALARQHGVLPRSLVTVACSAQFLKFAELDVPLTYSAIPSEISSVTFEVQQGGNTIANGEISIHFGK